MRGRKTGVQERGEVVIRGKSGAVVRDIASAVLPSDGGKTADDSEDAEAKLLSRMVHSFRGTGALFYGGAGSLLPRGSSSRRSNASTYDASPPRIVLTIHANPT